MREEVFDVVVIGSGAGGGAAALELSALCREGRRVAVLEWGPELEAREFTGQERQMAERLYFDSGGFLTKDGTMTLAFARALGGSTVVYTGTSLVIRRPDLERWKVQGLEYEDVRRRAEKYLAANGARLLSEGELNENNLLFRDACRRLGWKAFQFPVNLAPDCRGTGQCNLGCRHGSKRGTHRVQLPAARERGAVIVTNAKAERIGDRWVDVTVSHSEAGKPSAWKPGRYRVRAKVVVVAAGAVQSPALLLRSRLPVKLPALGRYFTAQPAVIIAGRHPQPIRNFKGHPKSFCCDEFQDSDDFLLETCMYFPTVAAKSLAGFGTEHREMMARMDRLQMILALALDQAEPANRVTVGPDGEPVVDYTLSPATLRSLRAACEASARILFEAGAERVHTPCGPPFGITAADWSRRKSLAGSLIPGTSPVSAAHLGGGCRMGSETSDSVTDSWGQVHGLPWLFVADASLFPSAPRINPYPTIMALADRAAERILGRKELLQ